MLASERYLYQSNWVTVKIRRMIDGRFGHTFASCRSPLSCRRCTWPKQFVSAWRRPILPRSALGSLWLVVSMFCSFNVSSHHSFCGKKLWKYFEREKYFVFALRKSLLKMFMAFFLSISFNSYICVPICLLLYFTLSLCLHDTPTFVSSMYLHLRLHLFYIFVSLFTLVYYLPFCFNVWCRKFSQCFVSVLGYVTSNCIQSLSLTRHTYVLTYVPCIFMYVWCKIVPLIAIHRFSISMWVSLFV